MKITIDVPKEAVAAILEYEYATVAPQYLPETMTAAFIRAKLVQHFTATSDHCMQMFGKQGPTNWVQDIIRRARIR